MNLLILGDVVGSPGKEILQSELPKIIKEKNIDFTIVNGENCNDTGFGITKKDFNFLTDLGANVITSGNHIWDQSETMNYIDQEQRLLRPFNLPDGSPGNGYGTFKIKESKLNITVVNLMGNLFIKKCENLFKAAEKIKEKFKLKKNSDLIIIDIHAETTSEKMAIGHFFDGYVTAVIGTHTHVPTSDSRILKNGTAYQTDLGMCGDYDSVIGMNKENSINKFLNKKDTKKHFPASGKASLSGVIIKTDEKTGLSLSIEPLIIGGSLKN